MQIWIWCPQFYWIGVWTTHVPSSKIPKRQLGSCVSKTGVNLHEIVGIRLDDTSKHKDSYMNIQASVQRCKEIRRTKRVAQIKQGKHIIAQSEERVCIKQTNIIRMCSRKLLHLNKPQEGQMQPHKHKPTRGNKHGKTQIWVDKHDKKHRTKQANTCINEMIQIL